MLFLKSTIIASVLSLTVTAQAQELRATKVAVSNLLRQRGILIGAIRPPTVPAGTSRLRITLSAAHSNEQVQQLLEQLAACWTDV